MPDFNFPGMTTTPTGAAPGAPPPPPTLRIDPATGVLQQLVPDYGWSAEGGQVVIGYHWEALPQSYLPRPEGGGGGGVDYASQLANDLAVLQAQQAFQAQQAGTITPYQQAGLGLEQQQLTAQQGQFAQTFGLQQQQFGATLLEQAANRQFQQQQLALQATMEQNRRREGLLTLANQLAMAAQEMQQQSRMLLSDLQPDPFKFSLAMQNLQPAGPTSFDVYRQQLQAQANAPVPLPNVGGDIGSLQSSVTQLQNFLAQPRPVSPVGGLAGGGSMNVKQGGTGQGILVGDGAGVIPGVTEVLELLPNGGVRVIPIEGTAQTGGYYYGDVSGNVSPTFSDPGQLAAYLQSKGATLTPTGGGYLPTWPAPAPAAAAPTPTVDPFEKYMEELRRMQVASDAQFQQLLRGISGGGGGGTPPPAPPPGPPPVQFPTAADLQSIDFLTPSFAGTPTLSELTPGLREEFGYLPEGTPSFPITGNIPAFQGLLNPFTFGATDLAATQRTQLPTQIAELQTKLADPSLTASQRTRAQTQLTSAQNKLAALPPVPPQYVLPAVHRIALRLAQLQQQNPTIYRIVASAYNQAGVPREDLESLFRSALPPVAPGASSLGQTVLA